MYLEGLNCAKKPPVRGHFGGDKDAADVEFRWWNWRWRLEYATVTVIDGGVVARITKTLTA
jgi:hypothetical protein